MFLFCVKNGRSRWFSLEKQGDEMTEGYEPGCWYRLLVTDSSVKRTAITIMSAACSSIFFFFLLMTIITAIAGHKHDHLSLRIMTVATELTPGFQRFNRSAHVYGLKLEVLGMGTVWKGGDVRKYTGGGHKILLLIDAIKRYKNDPSVVIMFTDGYDVLIDGTEDRILSKFVAANASILFSAETFCWPDRTLANEYPHVEYGLKRYLNSGAYIGFAGPLYDLLTSEKIENQDDDQLFLTKIFLNNLKHKKWDLKLDSRSELFQNLNGLPAGELELVFNDDGYARIINTMSRSNPLVIHGNGYSKMYLNSLGNYLTKSFSSRSGCTVCDPVFNETEILNKTLLVSLFVFKPTPFLPFFFNSVLRLNFSKSKVHLLVHNSQTFHEKHVPDFLSKKGVEEYASVKVTGFGSSFADQLRNKWRKESLGTNEVDEETISDEATARTIGLWVQTASSFKNSDLWFFF